MNNSHSLIEALAKSKVYQDYERAFSDATGLLSACAPWNRGNCPITAS